MDFTHETLATVSIVILTAVLLLFFYRMLSEMVGRSGAGVLTLLLGVILLEPVFVGQQDDEKVIAAVEAGASLACSKSSGLLWGRITQEFYLEHPRLMDWKDGERRIRDVSTNEVFMACDCEPLMLRDTQVIKETK